MMDILRGMQVRGLPPIKNGARYFHFGYFKGRQGQNTKRCLGIVQKYLIQEALADDLPLLNKQLTAFRTDSINFSGSKKARANYPKRSLIKAD